MIDNSANEKAERFKEIFGFLPVGGKLMDHETRIVRAVLKERASAVATAEASLEKALALPDGATVEQMVAAHEAAIGINSAINQARAVWDNARAQAGRAGFSQE